jgi:hypothetical protein
MQQGTLHRSILSFREPASMLHLWCHHDDHDAAAAVQLFRRSLQISFAGMLLDVAAITYKQHMAWKSLFLPDLV